MSRVYPQIGGRVETTAPDGTAIVRTVTAMSARPDQSMYVTVEDEDGRKAILVLTPVGEDGWHYTAPPVNLARSLEVAERVLAGVTFHGSATAPERLLATALLEVTGHRDRPHPCRIQTPHPIQNRR